MKNLIAVLTIFMLISGCNLTYGQIGPEWIQRYTGSGNNADAANSIAVDNSGNVYVTGYSPGSAAGNDYVTIKYNSNGDSLWIRRYNGPGNNNDQATSLAVDNSGNVYVTGYSVGSGSGYDYTTIKYNTNGDSLWVERYNGQGNGDDQPKEIKIDSSGNVYVTGYSLGGSIDYLEYATIKYNSNGDSLWVKKLNGAEYSYDKPTSIAVDGSGSVYVTGFSIGNGTGEDYLTVKYNLFGVEQWVRRYNGGQGYDAANSIAVDVSGNVYVTGVSPGALTSNDYLTIKYNSNGDSLWVKRYDGGFGGFDVATSVAVDGSGNVYVTGYSAGSVYNTIKYNSSGVLQWIRNFNGVQPYPVIIKSDVAGNLYVTCTSSNDYATIKYNSNGDSLWVQRYNAPADWINVATSMTVDGLGNAYVTGYSTGNGFDYSTIKYSALPRTLHLTTLIEGFYNQLSNKMISDTVTVCLRNSTVPYGIVDLAKTVLDSSGNGSFKFYNASNTIPYYIVIKHRNSIETWSSGLNSFLLNNLTYNFTAAANTYGNNVILKGTKYCVYSGDVNQDEIVDLTDLSLIDNDAFNFVSGYVEADLTGENFVDLSDLSIADNNAYNFVRLLRP